MVHVPQLCVAFLTVQFAWIEKGHIVQIYWAHAQC